MIVVLSLICTLLCAILIAMIFFMRNKINILTKESEQNFRAITAESLDRNARALRQDNADQLQSLLTPLRIRLEDFNRELALNHTDAAASRKSLSDQIDRLMRLNLSIGDEARNLANALRGNNRVQGEWGEMILQSLLEKAGLKKGVNFDTQLTRDSSGNPIVGDDGRARRPDLVIFLPEDRKIIVDSKTSLSAYLDYCDAEDDARAADAIKRHVVSVRKHIDELAARQYSRFVENAAEQVLMFIPNDSAMIAALDHDSSLVGYALEKKVVLVSPTQITGLVMIISQIWRKEAQDRNAAEIARLGGLLHDTAKDFLTDLQGVEKGLKAAQKSYENALSRLTNGSRSFISRAERLRDLGAKTSRMP